MKKALSLLLCYTLGMAALVLNADQVVSSLLPGSIDFNESALWGKEVRFGLDDNGTYKGATRWYIGKHADPSTIDRHSGKGSGYLRVPGDGDVHRTLMELPATSGKYGPPAENGREIPNGGIYIDTKVTATVTTDLEIQIEPEDKLTCWIYRPTAEATPVLAVTAASTDGTLTPTNYLTSTVVEPGVEFQLTIKATNTEETVGFEVYVNGAKVECDGVTLFPSLQADTSEYAQKLYSFGITGETEVDKINFTQKDPIVDPTYDQDDLSMLVESAEIKVSGYAASGSGLVGFPMLVRISEKDQKPKNFYYSRVDAFGNGIRFTDENGKLIPHEVEKWDPEGESLVWVKVPYFRNGATIRMHWSLADNMSAPTVDPSAVWSDYIAVWHFATLADGSLSLEDSTGHGYTANRHILPSVYEEGAIGSAAINDDVADEQVKAADYSVKYPGVADGFSFTGWYKLPGIRSAQIKIAGKGTGTNTEYKTASYLGWALSNQAFTKPKFWGDAGSGVDCAVVATDMRLAFAHVGMVYDGRTITSYANGTKGSAITAKITSVTNEISLINRFGMAADEIRISLSEKMRTADWMAAEYGSAQDENYLTYGQGNVKGTDNYWVRKPSVSPSVSVPIEEIDTITYDAGQPRYGAAVLRFYDIQGNLLATRPTTAGSYRMVSTVAKGAHDGLVAEVAFVIYEKQGYHTIKGYDRIMLFNSDAAEDAPVNLQGYYDVDDNTNKVWKHEGGKWTGTGKFVKPGTNHVYYSAEDGKRLWTFRHARIGNLFRSDDSLEPGMHFLPWGGTAMRYDDSEMPANAQRYAGTLILQNGFGDEYTDPAGAYSPIYKDGIGAIYFDAVNSHSAYPNSLKLQICGTDDEDVRQGKWTDLPVDVFSIRNGAYDQATSSFGVTNIQLKVTGSLGSDNSFYRIRAALDTNTPVRVRIIRVDTNWEGDGGSYTGVDGEGLAQIDNIIVSYPAMGAKISQYGAPAEADNTAFRGQRAPFNIAFPSAEDLTSGNLHGRVRVTYIANNTNENDTSFIGALTMKYRWRYLDQFVDDWKSVLLLPLDDDPNCFETASALTGRGMGDIEYSAEAVVNAPFYDYWDYTGMGGWSWPDGFSERRGNVMINAAVDGVYGDKAFDYYSPAFGTNYFIRLRDGRSDYQGFRLHVKRANDKTSSAIEMTLVNDNTWRGFYQTLTNVEAGLLYKIEGYNRQDELGGDYQWNTNWYFGKDAVETPVNDVLEEGDGSTWTKLPCDGVTGYLMFQYDDSSKAITIIHADYQNFNNWTDAAATGSKFVGTSKDLPVAGVSRETMSFSDVFNHFEESIATNNNWIETFTLTGGYVVGEDPDYPIDESFYGDDRNTPNGWLASSGMWVCEKYRELGGKTFALQLMSDGFGKLLMNQTLAPRGLETFTYSARVAQSYDTHPFNYYVGREEDVYNMSNYTFVVQAAMTTNSVNDFTGVGTLSVVANFRDSKGGYEFRVERVAEKTVQLSLYKWYADGVIEELGKSQKTYDYSASGLGHLNSAFSGLYISCSNTPTSVRISAGLLATKQNVNTTLSGSSYYSVCYEDTDSDTWYRSGTFGVGSKDCPAMFLLPKLSEVAVDWTQATAKTKQIEGTNFRYATDKSVINFEGEQPTIADESEYDKWNVYTDRLPEAYYCNSGSTTKYFGFQAKALAQIIYLETSAHLKNKWKAVATNIVDSFGFEVITNCVYATEDLDIRLRTGSLVGSSDVVVDNLEARQWRGEDFDDEMNPDRMQFPGYGAPTNFVYTTGWVQEDGAIEISPARTLAGSPASIRSPLMDGGSNRGIGLGEFSFSYRDADRRCRLLLQVATNDVDVTELSDLTKRESLGWTTIGDPISFLEMNEDDLAAGRINCYIGIHGVKGVMRIIVDPSLIDEAQGIPDYGRIVITSAGAKDNPELDKGSWWGWNLRTTGAADPDKWLLGDGSKGAYAAGKSFALNNSIEVDVREDDVYDIHKPFLQTPVFTQGVIGEVSFKARKYNAADPNPTVAIYGTKSHDPSAKDAEFYYLTEIEITSVRYETYTYQAAINDNYTAFRLAITGVDKIVGDGSDYRSDDPPQGPEPKTGVIRRALIDEVAVFEAIKARMAFKNVGAFRSNLDNNNTVPNMPSADEQPLCKEAWGVQAELYAITLSDRVDRSREPQVTLHWYEGTTPWGYTNWVSNSAAKAAVLSRVSDSSNLVYRSSYLESPGAVITPSDKAGTVVQYSLEVVYYMIGQDNPLTNTLSIGDWEIPDWYHPVDYNSSYGKGKAFAAYTILDAVAPGWAWLNEINLFGARENYVNSDKANQYVEIAAPAEADITGWSVRVVYPETSSDSVVTNRLVTFGYNQISGTKTIGAASNMVFHVIGNSLTRDAGKLKKSDGTLDGVWSVQNPGGMIDSNGVIQYYQGMGFQLIRKSGIVEHEVVAIGTNLFASSKNRESYQPTNVVNYLNKHMANAEFFYAGSDDAGKGLSLGVFDSRGEVSNVWNNIMAETPGRVNEWQNIDPDHPTPNGTSITVYANLLGEHIYQTVGDGVHTNANQVLIVKKGSAKGTNIVYYVDDWYELKRVSVTEGGPVWTYEPRQRKVTVNVAKGCSNNTVTVEATAQVDSRIRELGVDDNNKYTPAIMDWLNKRQMLKDVYGLDTTTWPDSDGEIYLADFMGLDRQVITNLSLTEMYWLDICPTITNQCLVAGILEAPPPSHNPGSLSTNCEITVFMMISNRTSAAAAEAKPELAPYANKAWAPYAIRSLEPGVTSWDYGKDVGWGWSNVNFKVTGILMNGLTDINSVDNWIPLRYFVFDDDSFAEDFTSKIQVPDPHSPSSLGYAAGWGKWFKDHPGDTSAIFFSCTIDDRIKPVTVEILKPENPIK